MHRLFDKYFKYYLIKKWIFSIHINISQKNCNQNGKFRDHQNNNFTQHGISDVTGKYKQSRKIFVFISYLTVFLYKDFYIYIYIDYFDLK